MTAQFPPRQEGDSPAEFSDGPGRRLRVARQALGFDLDRIAGELHLRPSMVESLEHDDYDSLPAQVYVIGYIRKYARLVGLDPEPLLASYPAAAPWTEPVRFHPAQTATLQIDSGHLVVRLIGIGILILLAALGYVWWQGQQSVTDAKTVDTGTAQEREAATGSQPIQEPSTPAPVGRNLDALTAARQLPELEAPAQTSLPAPSQAPVTAEKQAATAAVSTAEAVAENAANGQPEAADSGLTATGRAAAVPEAAEGDAEQASDAATAEVVMSFDGPCWVDVRDSKREYKLFGEMKKGDRHVLDGEPPYSFILGNAAAVRITVGGSAFDLSAKSRGNVARFTLDPDELP